MSGLGKFQRSFEIAILTAVVLLCTVAFANAPGTIDVGIWLEHMRVFDREGFLRGYAAISDDMDPRVRLMEVSISEAYRQPIYFANSAVIDKCV